MNPRCQHPPFESKSHKPKKQSIQKEKPIQKQQQQKPKTSELSEMLKNGVFHFYDFEYAAQFKETIFPIEIGISTYNMKENKEISFYHRLLSPGKYKKVFDRATFIHGIDPQDERLEKNYTLIANELISYNNRFDGPSFYVSKEEVLSGDKLCIEEIFKRGKVPIPKNIRFITHIQLFDEWCKMNNVKLTEKSSFILNHIFKQLECCERCDYHKTINEKYHCALSDARHTALMELICIKHFGGEVVNFETFPKTIFVKSDWDLTNTVVLFTNCEFYSSGNISEISFSLVDLQTFETHKQQTFYLLPFGHMYSQSISQVLELFHQNKWTNEIVIELMNEFIDSLQSEKDIIVVCLKGKISKSLPTLHISQYLNVNIVDFKKQLLMKLSQQYQMEKQKIQLFDSVMADINHDKNCVCKVHSSCVEDCCYDETRRYIQTTQMLMKDYKSIVEKYGIVSDNQNQTMKTVVEMKKKEDVEEEMKMEEVIDIDEAKEGDNENVVIVKSSKKVKKARKTVKRSSDKGNKRSNVFQHFE